MNKGGGIGVGSASIVLVFAVLCLSVFSLITFVVAGNSKALVETQSRMVVGYYEADAVAERIIAEILESDPIPETLHGVEIESEWAWELDAQIVRFSSPVSEEGKILHVTLAIYYDSYEILGWRMRHEGDWEIDDGLNVWLPDDGLDVWLGLEGDDDEVWLP